MFNIDVARSPEQNAAIRIAGSTLHANNKRTLLIVAVMLAAVVPTIGQGGELQQKIAAVKQSIAENQQKLHLSLAKIAICLQIRQMRDH